MNIVRAIILGVCFALVSVVSAVSEAHDGVLLTVRHGDTVMEFDIEALQELGGATIQTSTIWTEGVQSFTGVPMKTLVAEFGLTSGSLRASAINDYAIDFPVEDAMKDGPMIAYHRNGKPMTVRDKGPLWIVFPFDSDPKFQTEVVHARSIWQLDRIEILD